MQALQQYYITPRMLTGRRRFMIPGFQNDDRWRMVEDEFVAVAHKFTAHLHAAQYQRLKERAKQQSSDALRSISRPTTGSMTDDVRRRQAVFSLQRSQSRGIKRALSRAQEADASCVNEHPCVGTNLQELMNSPRKKPVPLANLVSTVSGTRAAALNRRDCTSRIPCSLPKATARDGEASNYRAPSFLTKHTTSARTEDLPTGSIADSASRPRSQHHASEASLPVPIKARVADPMPTTLCGDEDSDSSVETFFDRRLRERRAQPRIPKRTKSSPSEGAEREDQQEAKTQTSQVRSALSIPSI